MTKLTLILLSCMIVSGCCESQPDVRSEILFPVPMIDYEPRGYVCYRTAETILIDGRVDELSWLNAPATELFVDIEGDLKPAPRFETRARMLWDSEYFYVAAEMEEPHLWGTLTERDAVIYHDNDFEVFIDPDGDSHEYYELEINALGTEWDLLLVKPYRDGGPAVNAWDITGLKTAISLDGTLNDPSDTDSGWSVEIAIPWKVLTECAHRPSPPNDGDSWWVNFSRVQWQLDTEGGNYTKKVGEDGQPLPEDNWVWSPQGLIAMHYPEMWGLVQFSSTVVGEAVTEFEPPEDLSARWAMRQVYYAERDFHERNGAFNSRLRGVGLSCEGPSGYRWPPDITASTTSFEAVMTNDAETKQYIIQTDGRLQTREIKDNSR